MFNQETVKNALDNIFMNWAENVYEQESPAYYGRNIDMALSFEEYVTSLRDWELSDILFQYGDFDDIDEFSKDDLRYVRAVVTDGTNDYLRQNSGQIFALPEVAKIYMGAN